MVLGYYCCSDDTSGESFALSDPGLLSHEYVDGWMAGEDDVNGWEILYFCTAVDCGYLEQIPNLPVL